MADVIVYSSAHCSFCERAKQLLKMKQVKFTEVRVDLDPEKRAEMLDRCEGRRSVPQIVINGKAIGGFDDLKDLEQVGELDDLLANDSD